MQCKLIPLFILCSTAIFGGCSSTGSVGYSGASKPSETVYVRDTRGSTIYRIQDGNIYKPNGTRVGRVVKR